MTRAGALALAALTVLLTSLTACTSSEEPAVPDRDIETVAAEARTLIDELAGKVGQSPEVQQDTITDCVPGDRDSGKDLIYNVRVTVEPGTLDRVRSEVAEEYEQDGWDVRPRGSDNTVFRKGQVTMGVTVFEDKGLAAVSGSGGCVR